MPLFAATFRGIGAEPKGPGLGFRWSFKPRAQVFGLSFLLLRLNCFLYRSSTILIIVVTISLFIFLRAIHLFLLLGVKRFLQFSGVLELRDFGF